MRFILLIALFMTTAFDLCMAENAIAFAQSSIVEGCTSNCPDSEDSEDHKDSHESHSCKQCHTCHTGIIFQNQVSQDNVLSLIGSSTYKFTLPKLHYKTLKRPPISMA